MNRHQGLSQQPNREQDVARLVLDGDIIVACNEHAQSILLSKNEKLLGQSFLAFSAVEQPTGRPVATSLKLRSVAALAGQPQKFEWIVRKSDGSELRVHITMNKAKADGKYFVQLRFYPLPAMHKSDETLLLIQEGIEQSPIAMFIADVDGHMLYSNQGFKKLYGYSPTDLKDRIPQVIVSDKPTTLSYEEYWLNLLCQSTVSLKINPPNHNESPIQIEGIHSPIVDGSGILQGFFAIHREVTDSKPDLHHHREQIAREKSFEK